MTGRPLVADTQQMIAQMSPRLRSGWFVFCTTDLPSPDLVARAVGIFREDEGLSLILPEPVARAAGFACDQPMAMITFDVHSALQGVGLTAAASGALAQAGIACNMVAAFHHDHAFVPAAQADLALATLCLAQDRAADRV